MEPRIVDQREQEVSYRVQEFCGSKSPYQTAILVRIFVGVKTWKT